MAGSWYPAQRAEVIAELSKLLRTASNAPTVAGVPVALVVPHAGWRYSGPVAAAAYRTLHPGAFRRVVVIGPSHRSAFAGFSVADAAAYATPLGNVQLCPAARSLPDGQLIRSVPGAHRQEHAIELQLPFLQQTLGSFCLIPILAGQTDPEMEQGLAAKLAELRDGQTLFVCSSDFIHYGPGYGYTPFGRSVREARAEILKLQQRAIDLLKRTDAAGFRQLIDTTQATICGRRALSVLLELLPRIAPKVRSKLLAHTASSDLPGARGEDGVWYVALAYVSGAAAGK
jgi:AmmeMemoRadiSam system protein B